MEENVIIFGPTQLTVKERIQFLFEWTHTNNWQVLSFDSDGTQQSQFFVGILSLNTVICQQ